MARHPRTLLNAWNLRPRKSLGQNFLTAAGVSERIVAAAAVAPEDIVLEIGPGLGALTLPLAARAARLIAVETDAEILGLLRAELLAAGRQNVETICASILDTDIAALAPPDRRLVVLGNLPYNISSPVLVRLVESRHRVDRAVLMLQKELVDRIVASPGGRDYGRLTVMLAYCATVRRLFTVNADRFFPKPKVDSAVVEIRFKTAPDTPARDEPFLWKVVQAAFGQRRKTLKNALTGSALPLETAGAEAVLQAAGIDPRRRAETLTVAEFVTLSHAVAERMDR
ncbi:MAG: 16S rRNA (adenine(1518)-N(6)/adenine(1519)-N(6))-dimethyltransferase RsmA [Desulfobacteraceae bacterium]|nr:16S rRNA (adenine(1518)-N(6)/adenine(1519)-N(6))-dimethyltransferase RsmA [Desulfobacteraceae bacterium]